MFAGWKDVPDAVMQYGIALAKETAAGRQREKGPTSPAHHDGIQKHGGLGIQGDMERQDVVQQESEAGQPANIHTYEDERTRCTYGQTASMEPKVPKSRQKRRSGCLLEPGKHPNPFVCGATSG